MKLNLVFAKIAAVSIMWAAPNWAYADASQNAVYGLAQDCVVVQSPKSGKYIKRTKGPLGLIDRYGFDAGNLSDAERFYMKPAALGEYLITDRQGGYLSSNIPSTTIINSKPDQGSEWKVIASPEGNDFLYQFKNNKTKKSLDRIYFVFIFPTTESKFKVQQRPASECTTFPEAELNVVTTTPNPSDAMLTSPTNIRGYADAHNHMSAEEFGGSTTIAGKMFHRWGVQHALKDCKDIHGPGGIFDIVGLLVGGYGSHNTSGWPNFNDWPNKDKAVTHTGYYYKWVERAHLSGLRLMTVYTVENEMLCKINKTVGKLLLKPEGNSCDSMDSIKRQVDGLYALQNYIDAQNGGPNKGFFRIVRSPAEARSVIADGKLAVVIGVEASEAFNCSGNNTCDANKLMNRLDTFYNMGVRSIFPVHKFDTKFGGVTLDTPQLDIMNIGSTLENGHAFRIKACDAGIEGQKITSGFIDIDPAKLVPGFNNLGPIIQGVLNFGAGTIKAAIGLIGGPSYNPEIANGKACNSKGLEPLGAQLINGMIDRKIMIDVDHQSTDMTKAVLDIAERRGYSGLIASHGDTDSNAIDASEPNFNLVRLARLGGHISTVPRSPEAYKRIITPGYKAMTSAAAEKGYLAGVGIGSDYNGLIKMAGAQPFNYPFTNEFGVQFYPEISGNRTFDFSKDGLAHYGLLPELMENYRLAYTTSGDSALYESIMNSAESYLQMWERATR